MVIAIAPPSRFELRRLACMFEHEAKHIAGLSHADMSNDVLYSLGPTPDWAKGLPLRYRGRAPNQMQFLR